MSPTIRPGGIFSWFGYKRPLEVSLDLIREAGLEAVCGWWGDSFDDRDGPRETQVKLARDRGLIFENAHLPYEEADLLWDPGHGGETLVSAWEKEIRLAAGAGVPVLVLHPYRHSKVIQSPGREIFFQRARRLGNLALKEGIRLAWENLFESRLVRDLLLESGDQEATGFCFDTGHANLSRDGALSLLSDFPDKLFALHLHDNDGKSDQHLLPGQGNFPWPLFIDLLAKADYRGALMLESAHPYDEARATALGHPDYLEPDMPPEIYLHMAVGACHWLTGLLQNQ